MTPPICKLEEQLNDLRSDQVAYKFTIENCGDLPIRLFSVEPRVPAGARLLEITDTSLAEANSRRAELLHELNELLNRHLWISSEPFRNNWVERQKDAIREMLTVTGYLKFLFALLLGNLDAKLKRQFGSFEFKITSADDARAAHGRWMGGWAGDSSARSLFEAKLNQLEQIESKMDEGDRPGLTRIEPKSSFTATYVLAFSRRVFEPRKYQIGFDATYSSSDGGPQQSSGSATSLLISPYPAGLSIVTIVSALLGVLIRESLAGTSDPLKALTAQALTGQLLVGPIVAMVFFNAYEFTNLGKSIVMPPSWRSALLIGTLCGLAQNRILASLKALIGT